MISDILFFLLASGVPYFILLEKSERFESKDIFLISGSMLLCAVLLSLFITNGHATLLVVTSLASAMYAIYKATKTTNFYKLGYYLVFINAPFFMLFEEKGALHSLSLLITLLGIYLVANFYEKNYGSANFHHIRGITLVTPCIGTYLTLYLIALALYPPFPNSLFFLSDIFKSEPNLLWYMVVTVLFFGNFFLSMRVMTSTLFGRPNTNIHYVHMTVTEKIVHAAIVTLLLLLGIYGFKEILS